MANDKMTSKVKGPQVDKQAHTDIAVREGKEGDQARVINEEQAEKGKAASKRQANSG